MPNNLLREEEENGIDGERKGKRGEEGKMIPQFVQIAVMSTHTGNSLLISPEVLQVS